jgi:ADP-heptose:LPS heptosyltransferase
LKKILVIRFSSIGDIILTTPVMRCLKQQYPDAQIHFLTKSQFKFLTTHNPYIYQTHVLDKPLIKKAIELKNIGFDYIVDLHNNFRSAILKAIMQVSSRSFDKQNIEKALYVNTSNGLLPLVHVVSRYLKTIEGFGAVNDQEGLDYFLPPNMTLSGSLPSTYVAFAIGAQHFTKRMPVHKIAEFISVLDSIVVLLGGQQDAAAGIAVQQMLGEKVINLCGKLSFDESALVVKNATKVITHDTGLMHVAAAFKKEIISVWGNTVPEFGMYPYYGKYQVNNNQLQVHGLSCRPCSKIGFAACPKGHFRCMEDQVFKGFII